MYALLLRKHNIIKDKQLRMYRNQTENYHQPHQGHPQINKSPLRRQNINQHHPLRSPIRSRTPTRHVSPIKSTGPFPSSIKFISNLSPAKQPLTNYENRSQFSNGKNLKFINSNYNDKIYETVKNDKNQDYNKKSDRKNSQNNRLFGKLVDKIQSGKKSGMKGPEISHKTSAFFENSQSKYSKIEQTAGKTEGGGVFRQLFTEVKNNQCRSNKKSSKRQTEGEPADESEELNCLVYKIKNPSAHEEPDMSPKHQDNSYIPESASANIPTIFMKRKPSRQQTGTEQYKAPQKGPVLRKVNESEDLTEFNIFLKKIEGTTNTNRPRVHDEIVKMSAKIDGSLSMDPFL